MNIRNIGSKTRSVFFAMALVAAAAGAATKDERTVVFLGDSITHQNIWPTFVERYLIEHNPELRYRFVNAGVGGDTAKNCLNRLHEDVAPYNPDEIVIMFGMNDLRGCHWADPFGEKEETCAKEQLADYERNLRNLRVRLLKDTPDARLIWCTPSIYDDTAALDMPCNSNRNTIVLRRAAGIVRALGQESGDKVVDFNGPMTAWNLEHQKADPKYSLIAVTDRTHPGVSGAFFMACEFLKQTGHDPEAANPTVPWPPSPISRLLAERDKFVQRERLLSMIRWYLRQQDTISDIDDMKQVEAFARKVAKSKDYFDVRVKTYIAEWRKENREDIRAGLERIDAEIARVCVAAGSAGNETRDLVIYGGTPAAVSAAVKAKDMGLDVVMVSPDRHIGGLTVSGLGFTDSGNTSAIGGLARQFYHRIYGAYRGQKVDVRGQDTKGVCHEDETMWVFEPHVAEKVIADWLAEKKVEVVRGELLDRRPGGVEKTGGRIRGIRTLSGRTFCGRYFIDATYEGDLMAAAGVPYRVGRESNAEFNETWNGNQPGCTAHDHRFKAKVSPYRVPDDPKSGLCFGIGPSEEGEKGVGDRRVQAYCYRLCLTDVASNRVAFAKPAGYRADDYELLRRVYATGWDETFWKFDRIPRGKTDTNNHGPMNMDVIGMSDEWPEASYARREELARAHRDYQRGLLYFLTTDPGVPAATRERMSRWGLAADEFTDNDNWPWHLYVREGRRMVGAYVTSDHDCLGERPDPRQGTRLGAIGMGSYTLDSHNVRRYVTKDGGTQNEGDIGCRPKNPYPIDYGSIVPKKQDCENLLVPVAVSATHAAFGSIRMEPVFFILGESAATAAAFAAKDARAVQDVDVAALRARLRADGQRFDVSIRCFNGKGTRE